MAHHITGLIGRREVLSGLQGKFAGQPRFELAGGYAFLPLDDTNLDNIVGIHDGAAISDFVYLTEQLIELLREASRGGDLAYIETEYHGGTGGQGAIVLRAGEIAFGPEWNEGGAINEALLRLGVSKRATKFDAFDTLGLGAFRSNEAFRRSSA